MKNLEKEYKAEISNNAPDLWSRIEAGVDAYEASRKETAPATPKVPDTKIVKFDGKRLITIIGKISVAALIFIVVAVTFNMTRGVRKDAAPAAAETTQMADNSAATEASTEVNYEEASNAASEAASEPLPILEADDSTQVVESPVRYEEPGGITNDAKETDPSFIIDAPATDAKGEKASEATLSPSTDSESVSMKTVAKVFEVSNLSALKFLSDLNNLGLTDLNGIAIVDTDVTDATLYGLETEEPFSVAYFTAGSGDTEYLLFYNADTTSGIDILAVKNIKADGFLYTK